MEGKGEAERKKATTHGAHVAIGEKFSMQIPRPKSWSDVGHLPRRTERTRYVGNRFRISKDGAVVKGLITERNIT